MSQQYETANITYKGLTDGKFTVTLLDEKKGKWTIWKKGYQTEEDSEAYQALQNYKFGDTFGVSYQEKDESFTNEQGKLINFKKRTIYSIMPPVAQPSNELKVSKPKSYGLQTPPLNTYQKEEVKDINWDRIAYEKCCSIWAAADLGHFTIEIVTKAILDGAYWQLFQAIRKDGEKRFAAEHPSERINYIGEEPPLPEF